MNILNLIRFPTLFLVISCVLTGFYMTVFSGLALEKVGYLPHVIFCAVFLGFGGAVWAEMFKIADSTSDEGHSELKVSMSTSYVLATVFIVISLMISMTVSLITFFVVSSYILCCFLLNSLVKDIPILQAIIFGVQYLLLIVLGMSAHSYIVYSAIEPIVYIPLCALFLYITVLRIIKNTSVNKLGAKVEVTPNDVEMDSIDLSTEIDSVYPGHIDSERIEEYDIACKISDKMIQRNLSVILPENKHILPISNEESKEQFIQSFWTVLFAMILLLLIPVTFSFMTNFTFVSVLLVGINILFLIFPIFRVIYKKNITSINNFYTDGIISISLFNSLIVSSCAFNPLSNDVLTVTGILCGIIIPLLILKKHFDVLA